MLSQQISLKFIYATFLFSFFFFCICSTFICFINVLSFLQHFNHTLSLLSFLLTTLIQPTSSTNVKDISSECRISLWHDDITWTKCCEGVGMQLNNLQTPAAGLRTDLKSIQSLIWPLVKRRSSERIDAGRTEERKSANRKWHSE